MAKQTHHSVAQDGVAHMTDVRGFVGIDAGVLDDNATGLAGRCVEFVSCQVEFQKSGRLK